MWLLTLIYLYLRSHCNTLDRSTYLIPSADICIPNYDVGGDRYYFGPCDSLLSCLDYEEKCMFAPGRENYCIIGDGHFCALVDEGPYDNYFIVECG